MLRKRGPALRSFSLLSQEANKSASGFLNRDFEIMEILTNRELRII